MYQIALVLLAAISGSLTQVVINGSCPFITGPTTAYNYYVSNTWYQIQRIPNSLESGDCSTTYFEGNPLTTRVNREVVNRREVINRGTISTISSEPHRFNVTSSDNAVYNYYFIGTNLNTYMIIGRCNSTYLTNNVTQTSVYAWKLSRSQNLTTAESSAINQLISTIPSLAGATWRNTSHDTAACQVTNGAGSFASSIVTIMTALLLAAKEKF